jgi:hypothetical protein
VKHLTGKLEYVEKMNHNYEFACQEKDKRIAALHNEIDVLQ